jgi:hypothetical protein
MAVRIVTRKLSLILLFAAVAAGCKKEPSRWDEAARAPAPTPPAQPEKAGAAFNKVFPADGVEGYRRVFTQEKEGFAEARLQKDGKDVAVLAISDITSDPTAKGKFSQATDRVDSYPLVTVGKNQSALLVKDRFQVKVSSQTLGPDQRKSLLSKFDLAAL